MKSYIVFDMIGVVFKSELMTDLLYTLVPHKVTKRVMKQLYHKFEIGAISSTDFWKGIGVKNPHVVERDFLDRTQPDDNIFAVTAALKKKYRLAILSNMPKTWGRYFVRKYRLEKTFDKIILSGEVGTKKPRKKIYEIAVKKFGKFCFIDDRIENLKAAGKFGIKTILMERIDPKREFEPDYIIHSLLELKKILL